LWLVTGVALYFVYRRHRKLPYLRSQPHDWRRHQTEILRTSGDLELLDRYTAALKAADERAAQRDA
jgi:hypothetical protein